MTNRSLITMNKRGQIAEIGTAIFILGILIVGTFGAINISSENRYVGDKTSLLYYDLAKCNINDISKENIINFKNLQEAQQNGYKPAECSI